ncbi:hypothetical protein [Paracidovorax wautersii]|uniref:Uncharacterized protein n=1 Tax=Paracidovorax wautersii TaxID=1177982 RepID=A0A1I2E649_9BURK|nr:hypothetical protein [Paracidovorax wautersii]SFE88422.1 hypothetical protein SAMN04489711_106258 [Paracidovorax wautersii]
MHIERPRTYRATLVPKDTPADQVEELADAGQLPTKELTATSADHAKQLAHQATGMAVLRVDRQVAA